MYPMIVIRRECISIAEAPRGNPRAKNSVRTQSIWLGKKSLILVACLNIIYPTNIIVKVGAFMKDWNFLNKSICFQAHFSMPEDGVFDKYWQRLSFNVKSKIIIKNTRQELEIQGRKMKIKILMKLSTFENLVRWGETVRKFPRTTKNVAKNFTIKVEKRYFFL